VAVADNSIGLFAFIFLRVNLEEEGGSASCLSCFWDVSRQLPVYPE